MSEINKSAYSIVKSEDPNNTMGVYNYIWIGLNEYYVRLKKLHKLLGSYSDMWFVYGKTGNIHIFEYPNSVSSYFTYRLKDMKYISINKKKIKLWNNRKNFKIEFRNEEDKAYFDNAYINSIHNSNSNLSK